jgi:hypothetical protein
VTGGFASGPALVYANAMLGLRASIVTVSAVIAISSAACGGAVEPTGAGDSVADRPDEPPAGEPVTPSPTKPPREPRPTPPGGPTKPTCTAFAIGSALASGGVWSLAERVMGDGWLRFHVDPSNPKVGTADYLPGSQGGLFSCPASTAKITIDEGLRVVHLAFPAPCATFTVTIDPKTCTMGPPDATVHTGFALKDLSSGIEATEGVLERFAGGHCDAAFTQCAY